MKRLLSAGICVLCVLAAEADEQAFFQVALFPEVAIHSVDTSIHGISYNLFGQNEQHGLTYGVGNWITGNSKGFALGLFNISESFSGVQWGLLNVTKKDYTGWMLGVGNHVGGTFNGFQLGVVNSARRAGGFQLGLVNYAEDLHGLQIGGLNFVTKNRWFSDMPDRFSVVFPLVNWSF